MSLRLVPASTSPNTDPYLSPEHISLGVKDDGGGGNLLLNMGGVNDPTVADAQDLSTFFGKLVTELPVARGFRPIYIPSSGAGLDARVTQQFVLNLGITIYPLGVAGVILGVGYTGVLVAGVRVPFLQFTSGGSEGALYWRIDLQLRHSITN